MKRIALFENTGKPEAISWAEFTAHKLKSYDAECFARPELIAAFGEEMNDYVKPLPIEEFEKFADVVISFGGDGTMLSAARMLIDTDIPIMGVNVGKLGFLAEFSISELEQSIHDLMEGNYRVVDRAVIETRIAGEVIYALNDFVIEKKTSPHMIAIQAYANENYIGDYRADGVILTTPTGSTAYSLSAGGPIIAPSTEVVCLTPICPHSLTVRPLVIPDSHEISLKIYSRSGEANFVADGQVSRTLHNNETVICKRSDARIKLIKAMGSSYYDLLRAKLLWATSVVKPDIPNKSGD
ncbi:MAG: NAD(+)/NADH kinase [Candidatus Kapaibacterium sp.]